MVKDQEKYIYLDGLVIWYNVDQNADVWSEMLVWDDEPLSPKLPSMEHDGGDGNENEDDVVIEYIVTLVFYFVWLFLWHQILSLLQL